MRFEIGFVDDIQSVPVAQLVDIRIIGIMGGSQGVEIVAFHQTDVRLHLFACDAFAAVFAVVMAIDAV